MTHASSRFRGKQIATPSQKFDRRVFERVSFQVDDLSPGQRFCQPFARQVFTPESEPPALPGRAAEEPSRAWIR